MGAWLTAKYLKYVACQTSGGKLFRGRKKPTTVRDRADSGVSKHRLQRYPRQCGSGL